jgi:hypothetical protein
MTYEELVAIFRTGDRDEWISEDEFLVFKGDLNLRIEMARRGWSGTGDAFVETWTTSLSSGRPLTRQVYIVHYGSTKVMEVHTVVTEHRTIVPLPDSDDHSSMSKWKYGFGKIVEERDAQYGGLFGLDLALKEANISVRSD